MTRKVLRYCEFSDFKAAARHRQVIIPLKDINLNIFMEKLNVNSNKGFKWAIITMSIFILIIILHVIQEFVKIDMSNFYGILLVLILIFTVVGVIDSIKGIKEPNTLRKVIGMILNSGYVVLLIFIIVANILDIYKAFQ